MSHNSDPLNYLSQADPILAKVIALVAPIDYSSSFTEPFLSLAESIISQQLSVKVSDVIFSRLQDLFPDKVITAEGILELNEQQIRNIGVSWAKIKYLRDLATKKIAKEVQLEGLADLDDEKIIHELTKVKGIGRWTVEMFLIFNLGRLDIFSHGDLGLRRAIQRLYKLSELPTREEAEKISNVWKPYRSIASRYLWKSLEIDL